MKKWKKLLLGMSMIFVVLLGMGCLSKDEPPKVSPLDQTIEYGESLNFSELVSVEDDSSEGIELSIVSSDLEGILIDNENQTITFKKLGSFEIEVSVKDEGDKEVQETVTVEVVDTTAPVIESKENTFSLSVEDEEGDYSANFSAYDEVDGDLTSEIVIDDSEVNYGEVGSYQITVSVTDQSENTCSETYAVYVKDTVAPVLSLSKTSFTLTEGSSAPDYAGIASANDKVDGDLTSSIVIDDSNVDYDTPGTYEVVYTITDKSGNTTTEKATVTVKEEQKVSYNTSSSKTSSSSSSSSTSSSTSGSSSGGGQIMVTKTGECYHTHKCGNGNYYWVSMDEALRRGLRPCKKCY